MVRPHKFYLLVIIVGVFLSNGFSQPDTSLSANKKTSRITINSIPEGATVYFGVNMGKTPFVKDSLEVGTYEYEVEHYGYITFSGKIILNPNDDKEMLICLEKMFGSLTVNSAPPAAVVTLSNGVVGKTPFTCDTLRAGLYNIRLKLDGYAPYYKTQIPIVRKKSDTLSVQLVSFISLDSCKRESRRRNQLIRRIGFGTLTTGFFVAGLYYNLKTHDAVDRVKNAYNSYQQLNSSNMLEEFTTAHDQVEAEKKKADLYCQKRNVCYALAAVFCAGLSISIKF